MAAGDVQPGELAALLGRHCRSAELRLSPLDGHVSVLDQGGSALAWLAEQARSR